MGDISSSHTYTGYAKEVFTHFKELKSQTNEASEAPKPKSDDTTPISPSSAKAGKVMKQMLHQKVSVIIEYLVLILLPKVLEFENDFAIAFLPKAEYNTKSKQKEK